jgi:hypothetical protein
MVAYCDSPDVYLIGGPGDIRGKFEWVTCLSVFTHIIREDRRAYLEVFRRTAPNLLVDILPGEEGNMVAATFADEEGFRDDLTEFGYFISGIYSQKSPDGAWHQYYRCSQQSSPPTPRSENLNFADFSESSVTRRFLPPKHSSSAPKFLLPD